MELISEELSFQLDIKENIITGIYQDNSNIIKNIINSNYKGKICFINQEYDFFTRTIKDEFYLIKKDLDDINYLERIIASLNMVGFDKNYLEKNIDTLSKSEKILLKISLSLITNPSIIAFDNIFNNLDKDYKLILKNIIKELQRKYDKTIIIIDNDINKLYDLVDELVILDDDKVIINDKIKKVYQDLDYLKDNNIELPFLIQFSDLAKKYDKKLSYHKDINDLIKEIYKDV